MRNNETTFNMTSNETSYLGQNDPKPYTIKRGTSAVLFTGPHNGHAVPSCLPPCLGTPPQWFAQAHEARDLYIDKLFDILHNTMPEVSTIAGNYSRLVCDLNSKIDYAICQHSREDGTTIIPANAPDLCDMQERQRRFETIYEPYHDTKTALISEIRAAHKDQILVLDLHSFTPVFRGLKREVEISTIHPEETPLSNAVESYFRQQTSYNFIAGEPYSLTKQDKIEVPIDRQVCNSNVAKDISARNNLQYVGIEIRSDLLDTPDKCLKIVHFIKDCVEHLLAHPNGDNILAIKSSEPPQENIQYDTWSV